MLRISRGTLSPALNTPLARNRRPVAALTAILVVVVFVGLISLVGSWTATSPQPEPGAIKPPVVADTTDGFGIPYPGTGPAAEIIRGTYRDERPRPRHRSPAARSTAPASRTRAPGRRPRSSAAGATPPTGDAYRAIGPGDRGTASPACTRGLLAAVTGAG